MSGLSESDTVFRNLQLSLVKRKLWETVWNLLNPLRPRPSSLVEMVVELSGGLDQIDPCFLVGVSGARHPSGSPGAVRKKYHTSTSSPG